MDRLRLWLALFLSRADIVPERTPLRLQPGAGAPHRPAAGGDGCMLP